MENGKRNGLTELWFYENHQLWEKINYKNGVFNGLYETWYRNGQLKTRSNYKNGKLDGLSEIWYSDGELDITFNYKNGIKT